MIIIQTHLSNNIFTVKIYHSLIKGYHSLITFRPENKTELPSHVRSPYLTLNLITKNNWTNRWPWQCQSMPLKITWNDESSSPRFGEGRGELQTTTRTRNTRTWNNPSRWRSMYANATKWKMNLSGLKDRFNTTLHFQKTIPVLFFLLVLPRKFV